MSTLSNVAFDAIFLSEEGLCTGQNQAARQIFGYSDEEALGRLGTEWIAPQDRAMVMRHMLEGYQEPYEVTALRKDGTTFPALVQGTMLPYSGRQVRVTALSDISGLKRAQGEDQPPAARPGQAQRARALARRLPEDQG